MGRTQRAPRRLLAVTGGHRVDLVAFSAMLDEICRARGWVWAHASQPAAQDWLRPEHAGRWDAVLCHDIPGLQLKRGSEPQVLRPDQRTVEGLADLLAVGQGLVVLHHALAAWPGWPGWAAAIGGRFHYAPAQFGAQRYPASGYRHVCYGVEVVAPQHPICAGLGLLAAWELDDELYFAPVQEAVVTPLLRARADFDGSLFLCAHDVVTHGASTGQTCAGRGEASDLIAWTVTAGRSPVAVLQPGDGPQTFADAGFRLLLGNALDWAASQAAHAEAAASVRPIDTRLPSRAGAR